MFLYIEYGDKEKDYLKKRDPVLGKAIDKYGHIYRATEDDLFASVVTHIVGQQISMAAQKTILKRLVEKVGSIEVSKIATLDEASLQIIGITFRKASYIKEFADKVITGEFDINSLHLKDDQEVIKELTLLNGIGVWTAEMIMLFCMQRPDVISYGDLAIRRGMMNLYGYDKLDKKLFDKHRSLYSPYGSIASLYLWAVSKEVKGVI
jgi:DNA-3-methyladenine glycosylase II